jgi:hypothetical protein
MKIKNRIYKSELVEWQKVNDLQPELLKEHYNINHLRKSILKYGVSKAYDICEIEGELYWLDGHTRTEMFRTLQSEGIEIPKMLMANFCEVKNRQEAISILLEVHNIKHDPINNEVLTEWVNIEQVEVEVVSLNVIDLGQAAPDIDYSILDDDDIDDQLKEMTDGVKKAIQIEFEAEHYEEAYELVKFWREQKLYVGGFLMEKLKAEKDKL